MQRLMMEMVDKLHLSKDVESETNTAARVEVRRGFHRLPIQHAISPIGEGQ